MLIENRKFCKRTKPDADTRRMQLGLLPTLTKKKKTEIENVFGKQSFYCFSSQFIQILRTHEKSYRVLSKSERVLAWTILTNIRFFLSILGDPFSNWCSNCCTWSWGLTSLYLFYATDTYMHEWNGNQRRRCRYEYKHELPPGVVGSSWDLSSSSAAKEKTPGEVAFLKNQKIARADQLPPPSLLMIKHEDRYMYTMRLAIMSYRKIKIDMRSGTYLIWILLWSRSSSLLIQTFDLSTRYCW